MPECSTITFNESGNNKWPKADLWTWALVFVIQVKSTKSKAQKPLITYVFDRLDHLAPVELLFSILAYDPAPANDQRQRPRRIAPSHHALRNVCLYRYRST